MGAQTEGDRAPRVWTALPCRALLVSLVVATLLIVAPRAQATFHEISIREVYPGGSDNASYVVLQMWSSGQQFIAGHHVVSYGPTGNVINDFTFPSNVSSGANQATVLLADTNYGSVFSGKPSPDASSAGLNLAPTGGAVCWTEGSPPDCVAWGNFTGSLQVGNPVSPSGVTAGKALRRSIAKGCATLLDPPPTDDSNDSATDFAEVEPEPRNNATTPTEKVCPSLPNTTIGTKPADPTKSTEASFSFTATPVSGASFECKLDAEPDFSACTSPKGYTGLSEGQHTFSVRAVNSAGADPTPASHTWRVDLTAPQATILNKPPDPSQGKSVSFTYESNELGPSAGSPFECRLVPLEANFTTCAATGKTYLNLPDDEYTFEVRATDRAGNQGTASTYTWMVEASAPDITPPQTTIETKPPDPNAGPTALFTYSSDEPGSTFECSLDGAGFSPCPVTGIAYTDLANGAHSFQVRARDASNNVDPTPAGYSFQVVFSNQLALPPSAPPAPTPAPTPTAIPDTKISAKPAARTRDRTPTFRFRSAQPGATFECKLDGKPFKPCRSPLTTKPLSYGRHTLLVRTVVGGKADPSPARFSFQVVKK